MAQQSFLSEILARIAGAGRSRPQAAEDTANCPSSYIMGHYSGLSIGGSGLFV